MGDELIICRMKKFRPRQLHVEDVLTWVVGFSTFGDLGSVFSIVNIVPDICLYVCKSSCQVQEDPAKKSSQKKRSRSGNVPLAPAVPRGQTRRFGAKVVTKEGKSWYKKHTEASYFSDACIDRDSLAREFPQILRRIRELGMEFVFAEQEECNLHMVRENVPITPTGINDILGTSEDTDPLVLTWLNIRPPYQAIRHMICGPQSMA
ncbi:hypothetical protein H5410_005045 [Solanum commersonii]|uniref:Uncharacterized protein n=1 Tax=Solanum commersonii TaxID=4109 RepID=A0A9J6A6B5_SOLCO|nr:hypothetical protein H5410_005045 [Solanum commersonii]